MNKVTVRDDVWKKVLRDVAALGEKRVKVGLLGEVATQIPDGSSFSLIEIGAVHEFGTQDGRIPERSWLRSFFEIHVEQLRVVEAKIAKAVIENKMTPEKALNFLGLWCSSGVKKNITDRHIPPPLAESTVAAKGSDHPLIDTGQMVGAITYEVK